MRKMKVIHPAVYTTQELQKHMGVSYQNMLDRIQAKELRPFGRDNIGYRFSYFLLPKWLRDTLPVPTVTYES